MKSKFLSVIHGMREECSQVTLGFLEQRRLHRGIPKQLIDQVVTGSGGGIDANQAVAGLGDCHSGVAASISDAIARSGIGLESSCPVGLNK